MILPPLALSIRQPWAWAVVYGGKDVENRIKRAITLGGMKIGTAIAIHAAKGMTRDEYEDAAAFMATIDVQCPRPDDLVRGAVIGSARIGAIINASASKWFFGPWALELQDVLPNEPIAAPGALGLFQWTPGGSVEDPKPWMVNWPGTRRQPFIDAKHPVSGLPLFDA